MVGHEPQLGQNAALFQQCISLCRECKLICDTIPPGSVDPGTIQSLQADCDKCLEYGISEKSAGLLGEMKSELVEIAEPTGTDWGAIIGGGAVAGVLGLLLFGK